MPAPSPFELGSVWTDDNPVRQHPMLAALVAEVSLVAAPLLFFWLVPHFAWHPLSLEILGAAMGASARLLLVTLALRLMAVFFFPHAPGKGIAQRLWIRFGARRSGVPLYAIAIVVPLLTIALGLIEGPREFFAPLAPVDVMAWFGVVLLYLALSQVLMRWPTLRWGEESVTPLGLLIPAAQTLLTANLAVLLVVGLFNLSAHFAAWQPVAGQGWVMAGDTEVNLSAHTQFEVRRTLRSFDMRLVQGKVFARAHSQDGRPFSIVAEGFELFSDEPTDRQLGFLIERVGADTRILNASPAPAYLVGSTTTSGGVTRHLRYELPPHATARIAADKVSVEELTLNEMQRRMTWNDELLVDTLVTGERNVSDDL